MELRIDFPALPAGKDLMAVRHELDAILEDDGWLLSSGQDGAGGFVELELEDEKMNPKYGILAVKSYLQRAGFPRETTLDLQGVRTGIYE